MPNTNNIALQVPVTGSLSGTWGSAALNPNFASLDGLIGGVGTVAVSNAPVTLTSPAGALTPGAGPTQSENRVLIFTGALTANVQITLPLPGKYHIFNNTTGSFVLSFRAVGVGKIVAVPTGGFMDIWNDGTNCYWAKNIMPGHLVFMGGVAAVPAWISAFTDPPFLLANGQINLVSAFPGLARWYGSVFGGNGVTTFGVQDLQGRVPLAYDGTGTRITVAGGAGFDGQSMGAAGGAQGVGLVAGQNGPHGHGLTQSAHVHPTANTTTYAGQSIGNFGLGGAQGPTSIVDLAGVSTGANTISISVDSQGSGTVHQNVPPAQVSGIWLVAT